jgi:hypothetical protein
MLKLMDYDKQWEQTTKQDLLKIYEQINLIQAEK